MKMNMKSRMNTTMPMMLMMMVTTIRIWRTPRRGRIPA